MTVEHPIQLSVQLQQLAVGLMWTQPRILAMLVVLPLTSSQLMPGMLRLAVGAVIGLIVAPTLPYAALQSMSAVAVASLMIKEALIGLSLGLATAIPFWAFEAVGFLVDNQRGASIAASLNPLTGNDSSPLGILFNQAFIVFFMVAGGFPILLALIYDSFLIWPVLEYSPNLRREHIPVLLEQLNHLMNLALLYSAPVIVAMFVAEVGLALISLYVPQLQVFFLAMPIKSALALFVLVVYLVTLFDYAGTSIGALREVVPTLHERWAPTRDPQLR